MNLKIFLLQDMDLLHKSITANKHTQLETRKYTMKQPRRKIQEKNAMISVHVKIGLARLGLQTNKPQTTTIIKNEISET